MFSIFYSEILLQGIPGAPGEIGMPGPHGQKGDKV